MTILMRRASKRVLINSMVSSFPASNRAWIVVAWFWVVLASLHVSVVLSCC